MSTPFIGPSYNLRSRAADVQRTINMVPVPIEPGNTKAAWTFKDVPGLVQFADVGERIRGQRNVNGRAFYVANNQLIELSADGTFEQRGTLFTVSGRVGITHNSTQIVISDGEWLYVYVMATGYFGGTTFPGKARIDYINQLVVFVIRDGQQFGWTAIGDATLIDALDFASAESSPDDLVSLIVDHRELMLLGTSSAEAWINTGSTAVFDRNQGAAIEEGAASEWVAQQLDGSVYWLTTSARGEGSVIRLQGYQPQKVSTVAIEEKLKGLELSEATAYTYEDEKGAYYCLDVPGLDTTLVYDVFSGQWHERAELVNGAYQPSRCTGHIFAFGYHLMSSDSGKIYRLDPDAHTNAGDPLVRDRIMPASATPLRDRKKFDRFTLDCERGTGGTVQLRYSPDGGRNWSEWHTRSLGAVGVFGGLVQWRRLGSGRDLVVRVRCTDDVPFNPVSGGAE